MIQLPRRSVTRFFIPLIDVLILLFCMFLLLPLVQGPKGSAGGATPGPEAANPPGAEARPPEPGQEDKAKSELERQREELKRIQQEKIDTLQKRLALRVLEIDADTGKLYYQDGDQRVEIADQGDALRLIDRHKRETAGHELYYLFLYPRRLTGYPEQKQVARYERWFEGVAHAVDNPLGAR
jgi:hypothetical protein